MARAMLGPAGGDRWIPWAFVAFFGIVLAVNAAMIWLAFASWTGLATEGAYQKGLAYNRTLAAAKAQAALGWRVDLEVTATGGRLARLRLTLADRYGDLIENARVTAAFLRPTYAGHDVEVVLPHTYAGVYDAEAELPFAGVWDLRLTAQSGGDTYRVSRRVYLEP